MATSAVRMPAISQTDMQVKTIELKQAPLQFKMCNKFGKQLLNAVNTSTLKQVH
ncbi:MAG: hypothetical protein AAFY24_05910 [Pseudomonadota bacterium]